ncbi:MAG: 7-carboxy-7-deazaguanine synthase QueE [Bacteroidales bacterium]
MNKYSKELPVMEEFYSLQGEGFHTGEAAYFLRVGGCDVGCSFCDVKESWSAKDHPLVSVDAILERIKNCPAKSVIVTGGEPMLCDMNYLCACLKQQKINCFLETSGSEPFSGEWNWICFSPKKNTQIHSTFYTKANELKMIIEEPNDLLRAEEFALKMHDQCLLYLQPEWSKREVMTPLIIEYILLHPKWKISIQTHKFIHIS